MASKKDRLDELFRRLRERHPFASLREARSALEAIMREVEDELSGVPEAKDPTTALNDGRMYPPHDDYLVETGTSEVLCFKHKARNRTYLASNGAMRITGPDGRSFLDLKGGDGRSVADFLPGDHDHERNSETQRSHPNAVSESKGGSSRATS